MDSSISGVVGNVGGGAAAESGGSNLGNGGLSVDENFNRQLEETDPGNLENLVKELKRAGDAGVDIDTGAMELKLDNNGDLTEESKDKLSELIADLLSQLVGKELNMQIYQKDDGTIGLNLSVPAGGGQHDPMASAGALQSIGSGGASAPQGVGNTGGNSNLADSGQAEGVGGYGQPTAAGSPNNNPAQQELISQLYRAGTRGIDIDTSGMGLQRDGNGQLTEESKDKVNHLVADLTWKMGGREVNAQVYEKNNGELGLRLTAGDRNSVEFTEHPTTIYNVHSHPGGTTKPSQTDKDNQIKGAIDALIVPSNPSKQIEYA